MLAFRVRLKHFLFEVSITAWKYFFTAAYELFVVYFRCDMQSKCAVNISDQLFEGDPCPGTYKYVEAQYVCASG